MTAEESQNILQRAGIEDEAEYIRRMANIDTQGVRPISFVRLITMHHLMRVEYQKSGPVFTDWQEQKPDHVGLQFSFFLNGITVQQYHEIAELGKEYFNVESDWLELSDRTAEDYLKTLQALNWDF